MTETAQAAPSPLSEPRARPRPSGESVLRITLAVLCLIGLAIAGYLALTEFRGQLPACVGGSKGCATVAASRYSHIAGIAVPYLGLLGYLSLLATAGIRGDLGRIAGFAFALIGFGFSVYLTIIELFVLHAICQWCVGSAIVMTLILPVAVLRFVRHAGDPTTDPSGGADG